MRMSRLRSVLFSLAIALTALRVAAQTNESAKPQNGLSKLQMIDGKRHWIVRSTKFPSPKSTAPTVQELFVPFFMAADGFLSCALDTEQKIRYRYNGQAISYIAGRHGSRPQISKGGSP